MKFIRTHRSFIAWILYGFILFNGLACSSGHGQMLRVFSSALEGVACGEHQVVAADMDMAKMSGHSLIMKLSMNDCVFAGTLVLSIVFFIGLGWLIRALRKSVPTADHFRKKPPRHIFPRLLPQAP